jgi:hypothetical protein
VHAIRYLNKPQAVDSVKHKKHDPGLTCSSLAVRIPRLSAGFPYG